MTSLYHYTKLSNLEKIVKTDSIDLIANFYEKFNQKDYAWIKKYAESIVREICEEKNWKYDPDILSHRPYIISFCEKTNSKYMWRYFGNKRKGIVLEFNQEKLCQEANSTDNYACLVPCKYVSSNKDREKIKHIIMEIANDDLLCENTEADKHIFAVMGIMMDNYSQQKEVRYVQIEQKLCTVSYKKGEERIKNYVVQEEDWSRHLFFPKDILTKVIFGKNVDDDDVRKYTDYLKNMGYDSITIEQAR